MPDRIPHILVVGDDKRARKLIADVLRNAGYDVDTPADAYVGLDFASSQDYDLILVEEDLALVSGSGFRETLRSLGKTTPIVMLTDRSPDTDAETSGETTVHKPFQVDHLLQAVALTLGLPRP